MAKPPPKAPLVNEMMRTHNAATARVRGSTIRMARAGNGTLDSRRPSLGARWSSHPHPHSIADMKVMQRRSSPISDGRGAVSRRFDINVPQVNCGQSMPCRERRNQLAVRDDRCAPRHDQTTVRGAREFRDSALNLAGVLRRGRRQTRAASRPPSQAEDPTA